MSVYGFDNLHLLEIGVVSHNIQMRVPQIKRAVSVESSSDLESNLTNILAINLICKDVRSVELRYMRGAQVGRISILSKSTIEYEYL